MIRKLLTSMLLALACGLSGHACTSMLVAASHSATGRPLMWKHRDTGTPGNFLERVEPKDGNKGYVALFNDGDSLLLEAWMGVNDDGFAIMNTASYNVQPYYKGEDGEGLVMSMALKSCSTVDDFQAMLDSIYANGPSEIGINANFGVMDAHGNLAYFEADDYSCKRFDVMDDGCLIRTNYSFSGTNGKGMGHVRYRNTCHLLEEKAKNGGISPASFTEGASCSFWQAEYGKDFLESDSLIPLDNDYIPRSISTASIVIEGVNEGDDASGVRIWAALGYPPCSPVQLATLSTIPDSLRPTGPAFTSPACNQANRLRDAVTRKGRDGKKMIDTKMLREIIDNKHKASEEAYKRPI